MWKKLWHVVEKPFVIIGTLCSIISVLALCLKGAWATTIVAFSLLIAVTMLLIAVIRVLNHFLEENKTGDHRCVSSFVKYRTDDGDNIVFESHKLIQVKCSMMQTFDLGFRWSGENTPQISSDLQNVKYIKRRENDNEYDKAVLELKRPTLYKRNYRHSFSFSDE